MHWNSDASKQRNDYAFEEELDIPQPRFSIAIDEDEGDTDSFHEYAPRLSMALEEGEQTARSVEIARRAISERGPGHMSSESFGSIRASDRFSNNSERGLRDESQYPLESTVVQNPSNVHENDLRHVDPQTDTG